MRSVELAGERFTVDAVHRLALAVTPFDAVAEAPVRIPLFVGREVPRGAPRRRRRGDVLDPLAGRLDVPLEARGRAAFVLRHRLDLPLPPAGPAVLEAVVRLHDPSRRYVARRLRVPVWSRRRVEEPDADPTVAPIGVPAQTVSPWLLPGSAYEAPRGTTGLRSRLVRPPDVGVPWPRVRALGPADEVLGTAHGDDRGEFLLVLRTTGTIPPPAPSTLPVRLSFWVPPVPDPADPEPAGQRLAPTDPLAGLVIEDAVDRNPAAPPGSVDDEVLRGETVPDGYIPAPHVPRPPEDFRVGQLIPLDRYVLA